jgi:predicted dehydrogenase
MNQPLRAGIVGGGRDAFIGAVHRIASQLDGQARIVAGAMSSDAQRAQEAASDWNLERSYASYADMAREEAARTDGIDFAIIATPNHLHYPIAKTFLEAGIHVICDKPLAFTIEEGEALVELVHRGSPLFALTHNYTGYPAVLQARAMVIAGQIGAVRKVLVEYNQDWLMEPLERQGNKQAQWRTDPDRAGISCCVADIGTHAFNLLEYLTGLKVASLCADLTSFVADRRLDDDANILLRLDNGAKGTLTCSQIACGEENNLSIRVYGSKAALEWRQQEPNSLLVKPAGQPWQIFRAGQPYMHDDSNRGTRIPPGHPEGYLEAFANIYRLFISDIKRKRGGETPLQDYPTAQSGLRGMRFVAGAVESSREGSRWVEMSSSREA